MRRWPSLLAAGSVGAIAGSLVMLALPVPGSIDGPPASPLPPVEPAEIDTLLVWTPTQLPAGLAEGIEDLRSIEELTVVRSGVAWLDAWGDDDLVLSAPNDYAIPVEVAAIDKTSYRDFVPPADRPAIARLRRGETILGESSAALRELDVGGHLRLGNKVVTVEGVLDDTLVGAHELVVSLDEGRALGIERPRYILVQPKDGADLAAIEAAIRRLVPSDVRVRIRGPGETPVFRHGDTVLPQVRIKELFGEFAAIASDDGTLAVDPSWERENIETATVPVLGEIRCHRLILPLVRAALEDLESRGLARIVNRADFGGCYYPRYIERDAGTGISHHSWGIAIDINVSEGLPGRQPSLDRRLVEAFENQGFVWGGRFLIPDGTHFEFQRFP